MNLPPWIDEDTWQAFEDSRRKIRIPLTDFARKRILSKLEMYHRNGYVANEILAEAAERGWRSVFLTNDTPRRELSTEERHNVSTIHQMTASIGRK